MVAESFDFKKLSEAAFDTQKGSVEGLTGYVQMGFQTGVKKLLERFGIDEEHYTTVMGVAKSALSVVAEKGAVEALTVVATSLPLIFGTGALGKSNPWGLAIGTILDVAGNIYRLSKGEVTIGTPGQSFAVGQWVAIDNGGKVPSTVEDAFDSIGKHRRGGAAEGEEEDWPEWDRRRLGAKFHASAVEVGKPGTRPSFPGALAHDLELDVVHDISTGFYIGPGAEPGMVSVFNFLTNRDEDVYSKDVRIVEGADAKKLDTDEFASEVKKLRFQPPPGKTSGSNVVLDPGTEVVLEGRRYWVVSAIGRDVIVENKNGHQSMCDISDLSPGRTSTTTSYSYTPGGGVSSGFTDPGESSLYSGQYIWVEARPAQQKVSGKELVCVSYIDRSKNNEFPPVTGYYAIDGVEGNFLEEACVLVDEEFGETLDNIKEFKVFKQFAMSGSGASLNAPGEVGEHYLLCVGITGTETARGRQAETKQFGMFPKPQGPTGVVVKPAMVEFRKAGDGGLKEVVDAAVEIGRQLDGAPAERLDEAFEAEPTPGYSSGGLFPIAVGIGALLLLYNSIGF